MRAPVFVLHACVCMVLAFMLTHAGCLCVCVRAVHVSDLERNEAGDTGGRAGDGPGGVGIRDENEESLNGQKKLGVSGRGEAGCGEVTKGEVLRANMSREIGENVDGRLGSGGVLGEGASGRERRALDMERGGERRVRCGSRLSSKGPETRVV